MEGNINVQSKENKGSTFTITIPYTPSSSPITLENSQKIPTEKSSKPIKILIVEVSLLLIYPRKYPYQDWTG